MSVGSVFFNAGPEIVDLNLMLCESEPFAETDVCRNLHGQSPDTSRYIVLSSVPRDGNGISIESVDPVRYAFIYHTLQIRKLFGSVLVEVLVNPQI